MDDTTFTTQRRLTGATPDRVYAAFENPVELAMWWGPAGFRNTFDCCEFRPGGAWRFTMHGPDGTDYPNESVFEALEKPRRVVIGHRSAPHFVLTVTLEPSGGDTRITWSQAFASADVARAVRHIVEPANGQNLDRLQAVLAGGPTAS